MPRATSALSPELHDKLTAELEQLLDERDDVDSRRRAVGKLLRGELERIADGIARVRMRLKGIEGAQIEIPGTEIGERKRDPAVLEVLAAARRVRDAEEDPEEAHPGTRVVYHAGTKAEHGEWLDPEKLVGTREEAVERHHRGPGRPKKPKHAAQPEAEEQP